MDLIFKLIEGLIHLAKHRTELYRKLYEYFVELTMIDFEKVHHNYLENFHNYRKNIQNENITFNKSHPILNQIKQDMLFSAQVRVKLKVLKEYEADALILVLLSAA